MTDTRVETHVVVDLPPSDAASSGDGDGPSGQPTRRAIHFQEWWVRHHAALPAHSFVSVGIENATPAPGVLEALASADAIVFAPSNPVVSIGPILAVPGVRDALRATRAPVVGLSPIIGGAPVRGMADACLTAVGVQTSAEAVGRLYGARSEEGVLDGWLVDTVDSGVHVPGVRVAAAPLLMSDLDATAAMARAALDLVLCDEESR